VEKNSKAPSTFRSIKRQGERTCKGEDTRRKGCLERGIKQSQKGSNKTKRWVTKQSDDKICAAAGKGSGKLGVQDVKSTERGGWKK